MTRTRKKCIHDTRADQCVKCGGSSICEHQLQKYHCRQCNGGAYCEHDKRRSRCRKCNGSSFCTEHGVRKDSCVQCDGPSICEHKKIKSSCSRCAKDIITFVFKTMIASSKKGDILNNRFDESNFIDMQFLKECLEKTNGFCQTCGIEMQLFDRNKTDGMTIERIDNSIGHTKDNSIMACFRCNCVHGKKKEICIEEVKMYREDPDKFKQYKSDKFKNYRKNYYEGNKEQIREKQLEYMDNNKEKILAQRKEYILCECGKTYTRSNSSRHKKTNYHIQQIGVKISNEE